MEKQHLTYFKIENFKRFDSFEMSNLGQFNLIVGDNNVGKTSVLEGLLFDEDLDQLMINYFATVVHRRQFQTDPIYTLDRKAIKGSDFWKYIFRNIFSSIKWTQTKDENQTVSFLNLREYKDLDENTQEVIKANPLPSYPTHWLTLTSPPKSIDQARGAYFETLNDDILQISTPFMPVNVSYNQDLVRFFFEYANASKELRRTLEANLRKFIPNLEEIRMHRINNVDLLGVSLVGIEGIYPIVSYGDGTVKLLRVLFEVLVAQGKRLMVDEIGSGIHFTRLTEYWKTIIQLCDKYKVQLFASTHSLECQQAFIEALEAPDMVQYQKDARNISLIENKQGVVEAITFDFEQFEYALNIGFNTRGGKR